MRSKEIDQYHGAGGRQSQDFIHDRVLLHLGNPILNRLDDSAVLVPSSMGLDLCNGQRIAMTTDSYVVHPLFFDGGDIGRLAVSGTCNDLSTSGAVPSALSLAFILEEGFPMDQLEQIFISIKMAAEEAGVAVVTGDTKVVEKGKGDGIFINTTGIGVIDEGVNLSSHNAQVGDLVVMSGPIGEHEVALMKARKMLPFEFEIKSDVAPLNRPLQKLLKQTKNIHTVKDPTRGGVAQALHEICEHSHVSIQIEESALPLSKEVKAICELTGLDPLYMANEGKFVIIAPESELALIGNSFPLATPIGRVTEVSSGKRALTMRTPSGGVRRVSMMEVVQLPRIC